jgi:hypothetical protein
MDFCRISLYYPVAASIVAFILALYHSVRSWQAVTDLDEEVKLEYSFPFKMCSVQPKNKVLMVSPRCPMQFYDQRAEISLPPFIPRLRKATSETSVCCNCHHAP